MSLYDAKQIEKNVGLLDNIHEDIVTSSIRVSAELGISDNTARCMITSRRAGYVSLGEMSLYYRTRNGHTNMREWVEEAETKRFAEPGLKVVNLEEFEDLVQPEKTSFEEGEKQRLDTNYILNNLIGALDKREAIVIKSLFATNLAPKEIAPLINCSPSRVYQLRDSALNHMRQYVVGYTAQLMMLDQFSRTGSFFEEEQIREATIPFDAPEEDEGLKEVA